MVQSRFGLIVEPQKNTDYQYGMVSGIAGATLQENYNWEPFLPQKEYQRGALFDTMACVSFSALNVVEMLLARKYGQRINFSDRFLAKVSGTTVYGNSLLKVADAVRHVGIVPEYLWPWDRNMFEWKEFYSDIPTRIFDIAAQYRERYELRYEWVTTTPEYLLRALQEAPLQVTQTYSSSREREKILPRVEGREEHALTMFRAKQNEWWECYDHYDSVIKRYSWNYRWFSAMKFDIILKQELMNPMMEKLQENGLYQLVEGNGGFGLKVGNKFIVDQQWELLASFIVRNSGNTIGKVGTLRQEEWDQLPKFNLKGERL